MATITPRIAIAAASFWAARSCRCRNISLISRSGPRRRCATASRRHRRISGAPTPRSRRSTRISRCARSPTHRKFIPSSTISLRRIVSMPEPTRLNSLAGDDRLLFEGPEWDFDKLRRVYDAIQEIAVGELGLDVYPNQIEVITSEQMLDAYAS